MATITWEGERKGRRVRAEINVEEAGALAGITRTRLQIDAGQPPENASSIEMDVWYLRRFMYPDIVAGAPTGMYILDDVEQPWPLAFETFQDAPYPLLELWERETYRINPYWLPENADSKKKA